MFDFSHSIWLWFSISAFNTIIIQNGPKVVIANNLFNSTLHVTWNYGKVSFAGVQIQTQINKLCERIL
jgi:hypothetical protein